MSQSKILLILAIILSIILLYFLFTTTNKPIIPPTSSTYIPPETFQPTKKPHSHKKFRMYNFYHPSCGWCSKFMPDWKNLEKTHESEDLSMEAIDVTNPENENLVTYYNITAYPTIICETPNRTIEYSGDRNPAELSKFINNMMNEN